MVLNLCFKVDNFTRISTSVSNFNEQIYGKWIQGNERRDQNLHVTHKYLMQMRDSEHFE